MSPVNVRIMRMYEIVLWDWNGTLLDDADYGVSVVNGLLRSRGLPERSREEHARLFDFPVIRYYQRLGFDFEREPFESLSHAFVAAYYDQVHTCQLQPHALEVLKAFRAAGLRQSVLSATRQDFLEEMIKTQGLTPYFDSLLGIDSVHAPGKGPRGYEWLAETGTEPAQVLLIGDTVHDSDVAEEMGIECWLVYGGHHPRERLEATGRRCFRSLEEVGTTLMAGMCERSGS